MQKQFMMDTGKLDIQNDPRTKHLFTFYECSIVYVFHLEDGSKHSVACDDLLLSVIKPKPLTKQFLEYNVHSIACRCITEMDHLKTVKKATFMLDKWKHQLLFGLYQEYIKERGDELFFKVHKNGDVECWNATEELYEPESGFNFIDYEKVGKDD